MKGIRILFAISWTLIVLGAIAVFGLSGNDKDEKALSVKLRKPHKNAKFPLLPKRLDMKINGYCIMAAHQEILNRKMMINSHYENLINFKIRRSFKRC